jgi:hypothetical protein
MVKINESELTRALSLLNDALKENKDETKRLIEDRYANVKELIVESVRQRIPPGAKRVQMHTSEKAQNRITLETVNNIATYVKADRELIEHRLAELDSEWDVERVLEANAASLAFSGIVLSKFDSRWLLLPLTVTSFLLQHAIQGWCPPLPVIRNLGVRTRREIDEERNALKRIRGDFGEFTTQEKDPYRIAYELLNMQRK